MTMYEKIQALCQEEGFEISNLGEHVPGLSVTKGSISKWKSGAVPRASTIKSIADYFGVPVSYFAETKGEQINNQPITNNHGATTVTADGSERKLTELELELLNIFEKLNVIEQAKLIVYASELVGNK